jgi:hypothetical protein
MLGLSCEREDTSTRRADSEMLDVTVRAVLMSGVALVDEHETRERRNREVAVNGDTYTPDASCDPLDLD